MPRPGSQRLNIISTPTIAMSIPTIALFVPGEQTKGVVGLRRLEDLEDAFGLERIAA